VTHVYLIAGKAQHGKTTLANFMKSELEFHGRRVLKLGFADHVKFICRQYFGWDGAKDVAGRDLLQKVGTDIVRARYPDFWVESVKNTIQAFRDEWDYFIVDDLRFPNEMKMRPEGCIVKTIKVFRPDFISPLTPEQLMHPSETALDNVSMGINTTSRTLEDVMRHAEVIVNSRLYFEKGHKEHCMWATPLPSGYGYWGCTCGYDDWKIENED